MNCDFAASESAEQQPFINEFGQVVSNFGKTDKFLEGVTNDITKRTRKIAPVKKFPSAGDRQVVVTAGQNSEHLRLAERHGSIAGSWFQCGLLKIDPARFARLD